MSRTMPNDRQKKELCWAAYLGKTADLEAALNDSNLNLNFTSFIHLPLWRNTQQFYTNIFLGRVSPLGYAILGGQAATIKALIQNENIDLFEPMGRMKDYNAFEVTARLTRKYPRSARWQSINLILQEKQRETREAEGQIIPRPVNVEARTKQGALIGAGLGTLAGGSIGAMVGASVGTLIAPGAGILIGVAVGGIGSGLTGALGGSIIGGWIEKCISMAYIEANNFLNKSLRISARRLNNIDRQIDTARAENSAELTREIQTIRKEQARIKAALVAERNAYGVKIEQKDIRINKLEDDINILHDVIEQHRDQARALGGLYVTVRNENAELRNEIAELRNEVAVLRNDEHVVVQDERDDAGAAPNAHILALQGIFHANQNRENAVQHGITISSHNPRQRTNG